MITWNSESIKDMREWMQSTQEEFADRLGCRQQTVSEWETGRYKPRAMAVRLLDTLANANGYRKEVGARDKHASD